MDRILPILPESIREEVVAHARSFKTSDKGKPARWRHQGRSERGVDCVGLIVCALAKCGVQCEDLADYPPNPDGKTLQLHVEKHLGAPVNYWRPGDIVLFRWYAKDGVDYHNHVGMLGVAPYGNRWTLIHSFAQEDTKRVTECSLDGHWLRRVAAVYSLTGVVP